MPIMRLRSPLSGNIRAVNLPYKPVFTVDDKHKALKSLALPRGLEPLFSP